MERRRACWNHTSLMTSLLDDRSGMFLGSISTGFEVCSIAGFPFELATCCISFPHVAFKLATSLSGTRNRRWKHRSFSLCAVLRRRWATSTSCCKCATLTRLRFTTNPPPPASIRLYFRRSSALENDSYISIPTMAPIQAIIQRACTATSSLICCKPQSCAEDW